MLVLGNAAGFGLVAGIVFDALDFLQGVILGPQWDEGLKALGRAGVALNQVIWFDLYGLVGAMVAVWIYAAIRPRFGAGPKTAIYVSLAVWVLAILLPNLLFMWTLGLFPNHLTLMSTLFGLVQVVAANLAGAAVYKEA